MVSVILVQEITWRQDSQNIKAGLPTWFRSVMRSWILPRLANQASYRSFAWLALRVSQKWMRGTHASEAGIRNSLEVRRHPVDRTGTITREQTRISGYCDKYFSGAALIVSALFIASITLNMDAPACKLISFMTLDKNILMWMPS